ncbi:Period protein homolog lin-42 [Caenorhabditis elegans]|nr:Period protein homolog lin-42 [Caenorhabditis elegans]CZR14476.1 Period protein homolog lin-42 [Caenorhabditis elegans]|eukprot:NP_001309560.1 Period protein homolog lin-42 [Caenorhabditis elegans]
MELVVARHRICSLPIGDSDVISSPPPGIQSNTLPPVMAKTFEDELRTIMNKPVPSTSRHSHHHHHSSLKDQNQGFPANIDLGAYIDKIVEQLVVNSTAQQQQKVAVAAAAAAQAAQAAVVATAQIRKVASAPPTTSTDPPLSYTQINCLENVHRLLKSQSRPESPAKQDEPFDEKKYPPQTPLTREALTLHTKRFEDEYKDTWCRRLKRLSDDVPSSPPAKRTTPIHWTSSSQNHYRTMAPAPPPPPGKNYQITYTPLDDLTDQKSTNTKSDVENVAYPISGSKFSTPMRLSIDGLLPRGATSTGGASPTSGTNSPPVFPKTSSSSSLLMLRDSQN